MELPVKNLVLTIGIASALLLGACGKKDEDAPATQPQTTAPAATPPATTPAPTTTPADPATTPTEPAPADQPSQ
jgi:hypothetical protein